MFEFFAVVGVLALLVYLLMRGRRKPQGSVRSSQGTPHGYTPSRPSEQPPVAGLEQSEASQLNKQATALKKAGDMSAAVAVLREVKAISGDTYADTRLAKYLQQAGLFEEAMDEIQWLIDNSQSWAWEMFGHQPASVVECQLAGWRSRIHADAALISKRAKRDDLQSKHEQLHRHYADCDQQLRPVAETDRKAKLIAWEVAKAQGADAMKAYLKKR